MLQFWVKKSKLDGWAGSAKILDKKNIGAIFLPHLKMQETNMLNVNNKLEELSPNQY
jgi:hypothetical protein